MSKKETGGASRHARQGGKDGLSIVRKSIIVGLLPVMTGIFPMSSEAQSYRFSNVNIQGNERVDPATILTYAGIGAGEEVSAAELNDAYQNIAATGLFETIELVPSGNTLVIRVNEYPTINVIAFEGNRRLNDEALASLVSSQSRRVYSPATAEADAAEIAEAYRQGGRLAASVTPKVIRRSGNRVDLVFEITEGRVSEIERLSFVGNRTYSDGRLRRVLATKQAGLIRQLIQRDTLVEDRLEFDKQLLTDFYNSRGFIDFRILSVTTELDRNRRGFLLTFNVQEGQRYRIGRVSVSSQVAGIDIDKYLRATRMRSGAVYSPVPIDTDVARLERLAVEQSLNFIRIEPRLVRNERNQTIDVEYVITRGPRVFVERIDIEGNTTTLDRVVRRQFKTVEGDPFNPREIRAGAERIRALGFFADADVSTREGSRPDQVIVDVNVEEQPTGSLGFGAAYSTNSGLGFNFSFNETNFLGRGQSLGASLGFTDSSQVFSFNFVEPAFLGRDVAFGLSASYRETEQDNSDYDTTKGLFRPSFTFPIGERTRLGLRGAYEYGSVTGIDQGESSNILYEEQEMGGLAAVSAGYTLAYSTLSTGLDPTSGLLFQFSQDFGVRDDNASFVTTEALLRARKAIWNEEINLRAEIEGGSVVFSGGDSRIMERYSLSNKIRGFEPNGVGPRDLAVENEDVLGGNYFAVARMEADFPLGLPEEYGILGGVFLDVGTVWGLDNTAGGPAGDDEVDDDLYWRSAAGVSLFWDTPLGPLRFNFSRPIMKKVYDEEQNFEFTVSTRF
ncbi:outer membrane protein assembly factor BamA [Tropicimonas isoalkanivorans]|uniref:Outer membrane protein assembly factor BamA n=1 Tax=Tropicimonas isoalkanivorans TaxID=441112 RepID=A0A1I1K6Y2_9RHOB|nr:outer membrane protein assembly factor BamA [Tropicimonas isoalkanivorans]SFC56281.1 Beta-barrel assembly machine subunit BamA [Tropicimonas isoalkanivorans]